MGGMNLYHCMIELKDDARALAFAGAAEKWLTALAVGGQIANWRLFRRKFGLASGRHSDIIILIEVESLADLDSAFRALCADDRGIDPKNYELMHAMIKSADVGLYRPYPDAAQRENVALI